MSMIWKQHAMQDSFAEKRASVVHSLICVATHLAHQIYSSVQCQLLISSSLHNNRNFATNCSYSTQWHDQPVHGLVSIQ